MFNKQMWLWVIVLIVCTVYICRFNVRQGMNTKSQNGAQSFSHFGAQIIQNRTFEDVETYGALALSNATIHGTTYIAGSAKWHTVKAHGHVKILGAFKVDDSIILSTSEIYGSLKARDTDFKGMLTMFGALDATDSIFQDIISKGDKNHSHKKYHVKFKNCTVNKLYVEGIGERAVTLRDSSVDKIEFEDEGGIVRCFGDSKVAHIINGVCTHVS